jgi:hypothetical protein
MIEICSFIIIYIKLSKEANVLNDSYNQIIHKIFSIKGIIPTLLFRYRYERKLIYFINKDTVFEEISKIFEGQ